MAKKQVERRTPDTGKEVEVTKGAEPGAGTSLTPFEGMERLLEEFFPRGWLRGPRWGWPGSFEDMERAFDELFSRGWPRPGRWSPTAGMELRAPFEGKTPRVDVVDRENEILVRAELPGVDKDGIEVTLTDSTLRIRASTKAETEEEKGDFHRREISRGEFLRTLALGDPVDTDKAKAKFENGILELTLPKAEKAKRRSVKVE